MKKKSEEKIKKYVLNLIKYIRMFFPICLFPYITKLLGSIGWDEISHIPHGYHVNDPSDSKT